MSAPDTNIDKQTKRHKFPLIGMGGVVIFAGALLLGLITWTVGQSNDRVQDELPEGVTTVTE